MAKPPIEYRPTIHLSKDASPKTHDALEGYKAAERAKVLVRVRSHRAKKAKK